MWVGCNARSIFKWRLKSLKSKFSFYWTGFLIEATELTQSFYLPIQCAEAKYGIGRIGFMPLLLGTEAKYGIIFKTFFFLLIWSVQFLKKIQWSKFSRSALLCKYFFIKIQPNMSEQEKKWQRIYDQLNAETKPKNLQNNWSFFMALYQTQILTLLITQF